MNIYFSANARDIELAIEDYRLILGSVQGLGCAIINNWTEVAAFRGHMNLEKTRWRELCREAQTGIEDAETIIAEVSGPSVFGVGFEVGLAIAQGKPVLALVKKHQLEESYICGISHPLITVEAYDSRNVAKIIRGFIEDKTK